MSAKKNFLKPFETLLGVPIIFEIAHKNFKNFKYIILFLGKSGKDILKDALNKWNFKYEQKKSLTSKESIIVKISNLELIHGGH